VADSKVLTDQNYFFRSSYRLAFVVLPVWQFTYSIAGGINQKLFTIDPKSGALSFKSDPVDGKIYEVKVAASDGTSQE
jgi:hypothetical protein